MSKDKIDFSQLAAGTAKVTDFNKELEKMTQKSGDDRFWKPESEKKTGTANHEIRFLPTATGDTFVTRIWYNTKGDGGYYNEVSHKTFDSKNEDPAASHKSMLWNKYEKEGGRDLASAKTKHIRRTENYYSNILIVNDPINPENNGKVKLYRFGKQLMKVLDAAANPSEADVEDGLVKINPWEMFGKDAGGLGQGATLRLNVRPQVNGDPSSYPNYSTSKFRRPSAALEDMEALQEAYESTVEISELFLPKPLEELNKKFARVIGGNDGSGGTGEKSAGDVMEDLQKEFEDDIPYDSPETKKVPEKQVVVDEDDADLDDLFNDLED